MKLMIQSVLRFPKKIFLIIKISFLGSGLRSRCKILLGGLWLYLFHIKKTSFSFSAILKKCRPFSFRFYDFSDYATLHEIFIKHEYESLLPQAPHVILDLGSNIGVSLLYFNQQYPHAQLFGFEPDPKTYARLQRNVQTIPQIHTSNIALSSQNGCIDFYTDHHSSAGSSCYQMKASQTKISVLSKSLDAVINEIGFTHIDIIKFDIEGFEYEVFQTFSKFSSVSEFLGEIHPNIGKFELVDFISLFKKEGFVTTITSEKIIESGKVYTFSAIQGN